MVDVVAGSFAELLKHYRAAAGLTQEELAERAELSGRGISDLERGVKQRPYPHTVHRLIQALGLTEDEAARFQRAVRRQDVGNPRLEEFVPGTQARVTLPIQPTPFIGREQEIEAIGSLLTGETVRLLTLTGAGGLGRPGWLCGSRRK